MSLHPDIERLALIGWHLVPMARKSRKGFFGGYLDAATCDLDQLERWQFDYPDANWAVVPKPSGVFVLDVDVPGRAHKEDGVASLRDLLNLHGPLPPRPHGRSGGGGHLLVFRHPHTISGGSGKPAAGIDTLANRQPFTVSPSIHRLTGAPYRWVVAPWELGAPVAPEWLLTLLTPPPPPPAPVRRMTESRAYQALDRAVCDLARAGQGGRNSALNRASFIAGGLVGAGLVAEGDAINSLYAAARHIGLIDAEIRATIRSGFQAGVLRPAGGTH